MSVPAHSRPDGTELAPSDQAGRPEERERVAARHRGEAPAQERDAGPAPTAAVRWRAARAHPGPASAAGPGATTRALAVLTEFLAVAEHVSLGGYRAAVAASRGAGARRARVRDSVRHGATTNRQRYIEDLKRRKGADADQPHRIAYEKLVRV